MTWLRPHVAADALRAGPWCWPRSGDRFDRLIARFGIVTPVRIGSIAALTVQNDTVVLWHVAQGRAGVAGATLGPAMRNSWREAGIAVPRGLPVLWHSMHDATMRPPDVSYLASIRRSPGVADLHYPIDGPSFGLAFCLSLASIVLDCPLPGDIVASAAVDAAGNVGPVGGLEQKVAGLIRMAPHVTRLIVASGQRLEAETHAGNHVRVVAVTHAAEAVDVAFAEQLSSLIVAAGQDQQRRDELTSSFFRLALMGSDVLVDWGPVRRGARRALDAWSDLPADRHYELEFAHAVAARHDGNAGAVGMPPEGWLARRPRMVRAQVIAHLVQQAADAGTPAPAIIEPHALALLDHDVEESSPAELRLRGALARLHAVTGRAQHAHDAQRRLAHAFAAIYADNDIAYPLAEWARLAGALRDQSSLRDAQDFHDRMLGAGTYRGLGPRYVELALVRGRLLLDPDDLDARAAAAVIGADAALPDHVRWCGERWAGATRGEALAQAAHRGSVLAARCVELVRLDEALAAGNLTAAEAAIDALERYDPGPVGHLRRAGASPTEIARLYPY